MQLKIDINLEDLFDEQYYEETVKVILEMMTVRIEAAPSGLSMGLIDRCAGDAVFERDLKDQIEDENDVEMLEIFELALLADLERVRKRIKALNALS